MIFTIEVNNRHIQAKKGETILSALQRNGIEVPTLCHIDNLNATGACRICVVEVEGRKNLVTSCSQPVEEGMKIQTHSPRVIQARKTLVELLLANHPDDCLYCTGNGKCELQHLAIALNVQERRFRGNRTHQRLDQSCISMVRNPEKCILCGRCVRICEEIMGVSTLDFIKRGGNISIATTFEKPLNLSNCIVCGQCILACPTASLCEKDHFMEVHEKIHNPDVIPVVEVNPAISVSIAEVFGMKPGKDLQGMVNNLLRKLGFKWVFDTTFAMDILVVELADLLISNLSQPKRLPLMSSCCPAWVKYAEQYLPEHLALLAPYQSPQLIMGSLIKRHLAQSQGIDINSIHITSLTPCTAQKFEAQQDALTEKGCPAVDAVITTRELGKLTRMNGINIQQIEEGLTDAPYVTRSSAGKLIAASAGLTEALIRTLHYRLTGKEMQNPKISKLRGTKDRKELYLDFNGTELGFAVLNTMKPVKLLLQEIAAGKKGIHFIEVMACPGGCVNGGGQPFPLNRESVLLRTKMLYDIDDRDSIKSSHKNPTLIELYRNSLGDTGNATFKDLCGTSFSPRKVLL